MACLLMILINLPVKGEDMIEVACLKVKTCFFLNCIISLIHKEFYNPYNK